MDGANTLVDGYLSSEAGVDSGFAPSLLPENQWSWAINATFRGGFPKPRPGYKFRQLLFSSAEDQSNFTDGLFQGAGTYIDDNRNGFLMASISGRIFTISVANFTVRDITIPGNPSDALAPHAWFQQAESTTIVQNKIDAPFFWNGIAARRSNVNDEVPVGGPMAYGGGRLWVARGNLFFGGDLAYSHTPPSRNDVLSFTENKYLNTGGAFAVETMITGMIFGQNIDSTLGVKDLLVFEDDTVRAFDAPTNRDVWKDLERPIERFALIGQGSLSHESIVNLNSDTIFRGLIGINSFKYARAAFSDWGNTPISRQVTRALAYDTQQRLNKASAVNFENRMLMTTLPQMVNNHGVIHMGLVALDYYLVSGMGRKLDPAWEGVWTGLNVLRVITINHKSSKRCFIFALNDELKIELWEVTKEDRFDVGSDGEDTRIKWNLESKSFTFGRPRAMKQLMPGEAWYNQLTGQLDVLWRFRGNLSDCWTPWATQADCAKYKDCSEEVDGCNVVKYLRSQSRGRMGVPIPPDVIDPQSGRLTNVGYEHQIRLELEGYVVLNRLMLTSSLVGDNMVPDIRGAGCINPDEGACDNNDCKELNCCDPNDYDYRIPSESGNGAFIRGTVYLRTEEPGAFDIWSGRVGMDAAGTWITDEASLLIPQFSFWGGLETVKLTLVNQSEIDGVFLYTSVIGGTLSDQSYTGSIAVQATPWNDSISLQQFNPVVLGEPVSVDITYESLLRCNTRAEQLEPTPQDVTVGMDSVMVFLYPSTAVLDTQNGNVQTTVPEDVYDNLVDFAGVPPSPGPGTGSGFVIDPPLSATVTDTITLTDSSPEWASLLGSGSVDWNADASATNVGSCAPGPTNLVQQNTNELGATVTTLWHYHPFEGYWIFCVDDAAPWEPTSFSIPMATLADLGGPAVNRGEINGFGYELVQDFGTGIFKYFRSAAQVVAGGGSVTVVGTEVIPSSDAPFAGVIVKLYANTDPLGIPIASTTSAADGTYHFDNVEPGDYVIKVTIPAGYVIDPDSEEEIERTLAAEQTSSGNDFILDTV